MEKGEIGFIHGAPESAETKREKKLADGTTAIYTKIRRPEGCGFLYHCELRRGPDNYLATSQEFRDDLPWDEVERLPRFVAFLEGKVET